MDTNCVNIFDIYLQFRETRFGNAYCVGIDECHKIKRTREALAHLSKYIQQILLFRNSIFDELKKLMIRLGNMVDSTEFSHLYEFVFFVCRENGQKNITVSKAITAWKLVLTGRFRLLNQWCDYVQSYHRHNISEDTWQQVLAFSRCVYENLEGYDPEGAWPVLIDEFVEHMYRVMGSIQGDAAWESEEHLPGLKVGPGLKRKAVGYIGKCGGQNGKRIKGEGCEYCMDACAVEGCLSRGFACLLSSRSCVHL